MQSKAVCFKYSRGNKEKNWLHIYPFHSLRRFIQPPTWKHLPMPSQHGVGSVEPSLANQTVFFQNLLMLFILQLELKSYFSSLSSRLTFPAWAQVLLPFFPLPSAFSSIFLPSSLSVCSCMVLSLTFSHLFRWHSSSSFSYPSLLLTSPASLWSPRFPLGVTSFS